MYQSVLEFHRTFGLDAPERPTMPHEDLLKLRFKLTQEENEEKLHSLLFDHPLRNYLDAVADLLYVVHGDAIAAGISEEQLQRAFREVHESNMSKMWSAAEIAHAIDVDEDWREKHIEEDLRPLGNDFEAKTFIVKNLAGKVIKSPSYKPVDLSWIEK